MMEIAIAERARAATKTGKAGFTAETQVMRKNQNLRFRGVRVDRQFFHSQKTTVFSRCVDPNCLSSA